jgi:hypothetical protein
MIINNYTTYEKYNLFKVTGEIFKFTKYACMLFYCITIPENKWKMENITVPFAELDISIYNLSTTPFNQVFIQFTEYIM